MTIKIVVSDMDEDDDVFLGAMCSGRFLDAVVSPDGTIHVHDSDTGVYTAEHGLPDVLADALRAYAEAKRRLGRGAE